MSTTSRRIGCTASPLGRKSELTGTPEPAPAVGTEILPLRPFATCQAERAIGDNDRNTLRPRLNLEAGQTGFEPGMTVWLSNK